MKTQELNQIEMNQVNGGLIGGLLGGGDGSNMLTAITQGYINVSSTDEDGETQSLNLDFGSGSMFSSQNDD